jgi:hypothetical protein
MKAWTFNDIPDQTGRTAIGRAKDEAVASRLFDVSEKLTGVSFSKAAPTTAQAIG